MNCRTMTVDRFRWRAVCWLLLVLLVPTSDGADKKKPPPSPTISKLVWLAGNWRVEKSGRLIDEHWMAPAAGVMLGMVRTIAKGRVTEIEFRQIREGPGGDLFYVTQPSGQKEAAYQISSFTETAVVFANPQQDFPQKISFALRPDGSLLAVIEGQGPDGQVKRVERAYQRIKS